MKRKLIAAFFLICAIVGIAANSADDAEFQLVTTLAATEMPSVRSEMVYYVAPYGDDTNPGTEVLPFRSIQRAVEMVQAGSIVYIRSGTYGEFSINRSGSPGHPIIFRAFPGETPIVQASSNAFSGIIINRQSHIILDGFVVQGGEHEGILIDGPNASFNQILNCDVSQAGTNGILIWNQSYNNVVKNCRVHNNSLRNWPRGSVYRHNDFWGGGLTVAGGCMNNIFEENYVYWNHGEGVSSYNAAHGTTIRRNVIADNWSVNLYINGCKDVIVDRNLVYLTPEEKSWPSVASSNWSNSVGIGVSFEFHNGEAPSSLTITNNFVINANAGIWAFRNDDPYVTSGWFVANNTFINNDNGIYITGTEIQTSDFRNNIIIENKGGSAVWIEQPGPNINFFNNLYFATQTKAFRWGTTVTDFTGWKSLAGEVSSLWSDPKLQNASAIPPRFWSDPSLPPPSPILPLESLTEGYKLTVNSPAIDAGIAIPSFHTDFVGMQRPQGSGWDIGAYEFVGESSLQAHLTASPTSGSAPLIVQYHGSTSGGSTPYKYHWDFGDGNTSNQQNPTHTFQQVGPYTVKLAVTDSENRQATASLVIVVEASSGNEPSVVNMKFTEVDQTEELSSIIPGKWYDLYIYCKGWDNIFYADIWISHSSSNEGTIANRGGKFFTASNYVMSYSISTNEIWAIETEGTQNGVNITGRLGLYVDDDNDEYEQNSSKQWAKARFRLLENALTGTWMMNAYIIDKDGQTSTLFQKNIRISNAIDQTPPAPPQNVRVSTGSP
jgi:PKD repeat protein